MSHEGSAKNDGGDVLVDVRGLGKNYGNFWALRNVDLVLRRGESMGIIGMNGAGKSTLLKILAGTIASTTGEVRVSGKVVPLLDLSAGFNDDFTGLENLELSASILGVSRGTIAKNIDQIEDFAEIGEFVRKPMRTYSSGMRVRLAFALLTQIRPDLLIIDEVLSVGDAYFAHKCARLIRQFREEGRSLLFVSHDPSAVKTYCDSAILLDKGLVVRTGTPIDVLDYYNAIIAAKEREHEIRVSENLRGERSTRSGDGKAVLNRFDLLDSQNRSVRAVPCGAEVKIVGGIDFNAEIDSPTVGFVIRDRLGNEVFGTNTRHLGVATRTYAAGEAMEVAFTLPLNLGPGHYSCTLAVHMGFDHREGNHDWRDNLLSFSVLHRWPFHFVGTAALPAAADCRDGAVLLTRRYEWADEIAFNDEGSCGRYFVSGWCAPERGHCWTSGKSAHLQFELPASGQAVRLKAEVAPFLPPGTTDQVVQIECEGRILGEWKVAAKGDFSLDIPASQIATNGTLRLGWRIPNAISPAAAGTGPDPRELGLAFVRLALFPVDHDPA
ncbi:MAG TPA: ABC transporter ATP-binding protein [Opitutaceae bacterium]